MYTWIFETEKRRAVMLTLRRDDPVAVALVTTIREGDVRSLQRLLEKHPGVASARIQDQKGGLRTLLHVATIIQGRLSNPTNSPVPRRSFRLGTNFSITPKRPLDPLGQSSTLSQISRGASMRILRLIRLPPLSRVQWRMCSNHAAAFARISRTFKSPAFALRVCLPDMSAAISKRILLPTNRNFAEPMLRTPG